MDKLLAKFLLLMMIFYQRLISPLLAPRCRFYPTCSGYGLEAVRLHGGYRGGLLTAKRIARCHPWGGHGIDFVPKPLYRYRYHYINTRPSYFFVYAYHYH